MGFGANVRKIREARGLTIQELSKLSGVSPSMLSEIEREKKSPTIQLACKIAESLNVTLSQLLGTQMFQELIVIRKDERQIFRDKSGFERHLLSPSFPSKGIEFIFNVIPPRGESGVFPPHQDGVKEYITVVQGRLRAILGEKEIDLNVGDSLFFHANVPHRFLNMSDTQCQYFLVIDSYMANRS